jgi:hypothetical protein
MTRLRLPAAHREQWRRELARENTWERETPRRLVDLGAAVAVAAALLDAVLTYFLLHGSIHLERNPIIETAMRAIGIAPTLTLGALLRFAIVAALFYIATRAVRPAVRYGAGITIGAIAVWWCLVVFLNAVVVARPWTAG